MEYLEKLKIKAQKGLAENDRAIAQFNDEEKPKSVMETKLDDMYTPPSKSKREFEPESDYARTYFKSVNHVNKRGDDAVYEHFKSRIEKHKHNKRTRTV